VRAGREGKDSWDGETRTFQTLNSSFRKQNQKVYSSENASFGYGTEVSRAGIIVNIQAGDGGTLWHVRESTVRNRMPAGGQSWSPVSTAATEGQSRTVRFPRPSRIPGTKKPFDAFAEGLFVG
jgi:hypothetical protein